MIALMNQLLESLRQRVIDNLATIRANEKEIRKILAEPLSNQRSYNLSNRQELSKRILSENAHNLKIQNLIVAFLKNYKDIPEYHQLLDSINSFEKRLSSNQNDTSIEQKINSSEISKTSRSKATNPTLKVDNTSSFKGTEPPKINEKFNEKVNQSLFELTVTGKLAFSRAHPKFNDMEFFDQLLDYHIQREEYEICASLVKAKQ